MAEYLLGGGVDDVDTPGGGGLRPFAGDEEVVEVVRVRHPWVPDSGDVCLLCRGKDALSVRWGESDGCGTSTGRL
jgi:hypothetical protein